MKRSTSSSSDNSCRWEDESNRPQKKLKHSPPSMSNIPESERWVVTRTLGCGSVYLAESDLLPYEMVIKSKEISHASRLKNEESFLTRLNSPFVVSCYGHEITEDDRKTKYYNTILEYCPEQSLAEHIKGKGLAEDDVRGFATDILLGLKHVHAEKIIHCDIKPKNILILPENKRIRASGFTAKISGFGKAMEEESIGYGEAWRLRRGMTRYSSPELIGDMILDYGEDVWAFGCTVLEILSGERVWSEHGDLHWEDWIDVIGDSNLVPYVPDYLSENAKDFLSKCLERDPALRWSVDRLIEHRFLKWIHDEEEEEEEEEVEEDIYDEIGDADVEAYLENGEAFGQEEEAIEIDEDYPQEDSDSEDDL